MPESHELAKEVFAALAGAEVRRWPCRRADEAEVDKLAETKGLDAWDRVRAAHLCPVGLWSAGEAQAPGASSDVTGLADPPQATEQGADALRQVLASVCLLALMPAQQC